MSNVRYFTDYPVEEFGDLPNHSAPFRPVVPLAYDGDKYVVCLVRDKTGTTAQISIKWGYLSRTRSNNPKSWRLAQMHLKKIEVDLDTFLRIQKR